MEPFHYQEMPPEHQAIARHFASIADAIVETLPESSTRTAALSALLKARQIALGAVVPIINQEPA